MKIRLRARAFVYLLPEIWRVLLKGPCTVAFPFGDAKVPEGYRGVVRVKPELCRGCGACVRDCPAFGLELERESREEFRLIYYPDRCAYCGQCEMSCPFGAIYQSNEYVGGTNYPDELRTVLVDRCPASRAPCEARPPEDKTVLNDPEGVTAESR